MTLTRKPIARFDRCIQDSGEPVLKMTTLSEKTFVNDALTKCATCTFLKCGDRVVLSQNFAPNEQSFEITETGVDVSFKVVCEKLEEDSVDPAEHRTVEEIYIDLQACFRPNPPGRIHWDHYIENERLTAYRVKWPEGVDAGDSDEITKKCWYVIKYIWDADLPYSEILYYKFKMGEWAFVNKVYV
jgi:hypothetical protein